jgi:hypothetical protein
MQSMDSVMTWWSLEDMSEWSGEKVTAEQVNRRLCFTDYMQFHHTHTRRKKNQRFLSYHVTP